jgi:hypothetical protein
VKKLVIALGVVSGMALSISWASALPPSGAVSAVAGAASENSMVQQVRRCVYQGRTYYVPGACRNKCVSATWWAHGRKWIRWHYC